MAIQDTTDSLRMGVSALTENIMVGIPMKENQGFKWFKYKINLTNDFLKCAIEYFGDNNMKVDDVFGKEINGGDKSYYITVKRTK